LNENEGSLESLQKAFFNDTTHAQIGQVFPVFWRLVLLL
jgi:hypothetical protein